MVINHVRSRRRDRCVGSIYGRTVSTGIGGVLAGSDTYLTLYTFAKDSEGVSNCYDACAETGFHDAL